MKNLEASLMILVTAGVASLAHAQQPALPGKQPAPAAAPAVGPAAPEPAAKPPAVAPQNESLVRAILDTNPQTPAELVRAIKILVDLGEAASAQPLLKKLIDQKPDDAALAALVDEYGSAVFLRIGQAQALQPDSQQFSVDVISAAARYARDAKRIASEIERLKSTNPDERDAAVAALRIGRDASVGALLAVLDDPARRAEHPHVATALVQLGGESLAPLTGALATANAPLKAQICNVLGELNDAAAVDYLLAPALAGSSPPEVRAAARAALHRLLGRTPDPGDAAARLYRAARSYYERPSRSLEAPLAEVTRFHWDAAGKKLVAQSLRASEANLLLAARLAGDARRLVPDDLQLRRFQLTALASSAVRQAGLDKPLPKGAGTAHDLLLAEGAAVLDDLLAYDLAGGHHAAAAVVARLLGESGQVEVLYRHNPLPAPLVNALLDRDRRVRFAALEAIVKLAPREAFPGANRVIDALSFFAAGSAAPRALVADVHADAAGRLAALLAELGYDPDIALDARGATQLVAAGGDYELLFVDESLALPTSGQLLQQLRRDARTALVPLAVIASTEGQSRAERLARATPLAEAFIAPQNRAGLELQIGRLMRRAGHGAAEPAERLRQAAQALAWVATLSARQQADAAASASSAGAHEQIADALLARTANRRTFAGRSLYDLRLLDEQVIAGLSVPQLAPAAAAALANLGTPRSQRALVDLASRHTQPLALRRTAAAAFRQNLVQYGPLLSTDEIHLQYDRYNSSETLGKPSQQLLGSILDALEARAAAARLADDPARDTASDLKEQ